MIRLPAPHMALNASDAPPPHFRMWQTCRVPTRRVDAATGAVIEPGLGPADLITRIQVAALSAPEERLRSLVINCRVLPGDGFGLALGSGIHLADTALFADLAGLVDQIYIVASDAERRTTPVGDCGGAAEFCSAIARRSGATVYAADVVHRPGSRKELPYGCIDGFEGTVYRWDGSGRLTGERDSWPSGQFG
jgi:hypothetical protein